MHGCWIRSDSQMQNRSLSFCILSVKVTYKSNSVLFQSSAFSLKNLQLRDNKNYSNPSSFNVFVETGAHQTLANIKLCGMVCACFCFFSGISIMRLLMFALQKHKTCVRMAWTEGGEGILLPLCTVPNHSVASEGKKMQCRN